MRQGGSRLRWLPALGGLLLLLSCGGGRPGGVVLIVIDTLRADAATGFGTGRSVSPGITNLARRGTEFQELSAASPWTSPSVAAIFTGLYPDELGLNLLKDPLPEAAATLPEMFQTAGYRTGAVVSNGLAGPDYGFGQGFDDYHYAQYKGDPQQGIPPELRRPVFTADKVADQAIRWLDTITDPFFLYVHFTDPHDPYLAPEEWRRRFAGHLPSLDDQFLLGKNFARPDLEPERLAAVKACYLAEIAFTDRQVGRLLDALPPDSLVVLVGDHGEEFMEHGGFRHSHSLFEELLHVPLILQGPGVPIGQTVAEPVSQVDLAPTILDLAGIPIPAGMTGRSLTEYLSQSPAVGSPRAIFAVRQDHRGKERSIRLGRWKLHQSSAGLRLFDLVEDPEELTELSARHPEIAADLLGRIQAREPDLTARSPEDPEGEERRLESLRALGYID